MSPAPLTLATIVILSVFGLAHAQESLQNPKAIEPANADSTPPVAPAAGEADPTDFYRSNLFAERMVVTFTAVDGSSARSVVVVRFDPGAPDSNPRLRLTLGRLEVQFTPDRAIATYRGDPTSYFETPMIGTLTPESIRAVLPRLPVPQIEWVFGKEAHQTTRHPFGLATTLLPTDPDGTQHSTAADGRLRVKLFSRTARPRSIELQRTDGGLLQLDITPIDTRDSEAWAIDTKGRQKVSTLAQLQRRADSPLVGKVFRDLGFSRPDLSSVSFNELLGPLPEAKSANPPIPVSSHAAIFIVFASAKDGTPIEGVREDLAAGRVALSAAIDVLLSSKPPIAPTRLRQFLVRALPLETLDLAVLAQNAGTLVGNDPSTERIETMVLNTTAGDWLLKDQLSNALAAIVIVDVTRTIVYACSLDTRPEDSDTHAAELLAALQEVLGVKPAPDETSAPSPAPK